MNADQSNIRFEEVREFLEPGDCPLFRVFFIIENERCKIADILGKLPSAKQKQFRRLVRSMAVIEKFKCQHLKWQLKKYPFGEIKPRPHRFFFFIRCGANIVIFDYREKKQDSMPDSTYRAIDKNRERYEREFARFCTEAA